jgi:trehalose/maltose hydrolase-like predicted phosphorylase
MHALVAARLGDAEMALRYLRETAATNLDFDPNSAGGVRIAGVGALWQATILGFAGLDLRGDTLGIDPRLPPQWRSLSFRVCWRGRSVAIRIAGSTVQATLVDGEAMEIRIAATTRKLTAGRPCRRRLLCRRARAPSQGPDLHKAHVCSLRASDLPKP